MTSDAQKVDDAVELAHSALINLDNFGQMLSPLVRPHVMNHPMLKLARTQLVECVRMLGRDINENDPTELRA